MAEKKEVPKHIQEFYNRDKKVRQLLAATHDIHSQAYSKALDVIKDKGGLPDHEKLDETAVQDSMIDKMIDHYKSAAVEKLSEVKGKAPAKGTIEEDMFLKRYVGITRSELTRYFRKHKSNYTQEAHENLRDKLMKDQEKELTPLRYGHLERKHIGDILKHVGLDKYVEADNFRDVTETVEFLDLYKKKGEITLADLAQSDEIEHMLKKDAKAAVKEYKKKYKTAR